MDALGLLSVRQKGRVFHFWIRHRHRNSVCDSGEVVAKPIYYIGLATTSPLSLQHKLHHKHYGILIYEHFIIMHYDMGFYRQLLHCRRH